MTEADQSDAAMITKEGSHTLEAVKFLPGTDPPLELLEVTQHCEHLVFVIFITYLGFQTSRTLR